MKIAVIADTHLNKSVYKEVMDREYPLLPFRNADFMRAFEWMTDECINNIHPDIFLVLGDIYDHYDPSNEIRGFFSSQLRKLTEAKIPVIILVGNHDACQKHHALQDIHQLGLKNIKVIEEPQIVNFKDERFALFPHSLDVERQTIDEKEEFLNFKKQIEQEDIKPSFFFAHLGIKGATLNEYEVKTEAETTDTTTTPMKRAFINSNADDVGLDDLDALGIPNIFLGDYHRHQILPTKNCLAMYCGSIEKSDLSEADQVKGFVVYDSEADIDKKMGKCSFITYPNCRPMFELKGNFVKIKEKFSKINSRDFQNAIVKISFVGNPSERTDFTIGIEGFKKEIREKTNAIYIFHTQKTINEEQEEAVSELEQELMEKGHIEAEDIIPIVNEMIDDWGKDRSPEFITGVKQIAKEIYDETVVE